MWGLKVGEELYKIDNIPFYVRGISCDDVVSADNDDGKLHFNSLIQPSLSSVLRVIVFKESLVPVIREDLKKLGCDTELSHIPTLIAVNVPPSANYDEVTDFLDQGESKEDWEYEVASLRH